MSAFAAPIGDPPSIAMLAPARLQVDASYQRSIDNPASAKLIRAIASAWDWRLCVPLIVAQRPEGLFVIDGQHRREAAILRGDIGYLPCSVSAYADAAEEARLFVAANRGRRKIDRVDEFRAAVAAGDAQAVQIDALVTAAGLSMSRTSNRAAVRAGQINFTSGLASALKAFGPERTGSALKLIGWAFAGQVLTHGGAMFAALCELLGAGLSPEQLLPVLTRHAIEDWGGLAEVSVLRGGKNRTGAMRKTIRGVLDTMEAAAARSPAPPVAVPPPLPKAEAAAPRQIPAAPAREDPGAELPSQLSSQLPSPSEPSKPKRKDEPVVATVATKVSPPALPAPAPTPAGPAAAAPSPARAAPAPRPIQAASPKAAPEVPPKVRSSAVLREPAKTRTEEPFPATSPEFEAKLAKVARGEAGLIEKVDVPRRGVPEIPGGGSSLA